jgi:hypothetical protein
MVLAFLKDTDNVKKVPGFDGPFDQVMFHLVSHIMRMAPEELYQLVG